jgi:hypothetical protein
MLKSHKFIITFTILNVHAEFRNPIISLNIRTFTIPLESSRISPSLPGYLDQENMIKIICEMKGGNHYHRSCNLFSLLLSI